jgi:hypothetical protein
MALERLQNGWLIGRKENSTMKNVPSRLRSFRYGPSIIAYQTQTQPQSFYLLTGSTLWQADLMQMPLLSWFLVSVDQLIRGRSGRGGMF